MGDHCPKAAHRCRAAELTLDLAVGFLRYDLALGRWACWVVCGAIIRVCAVPLAQLATPIARARGVPSEDQGGQATVCWALAWLYKWPDRYPGRPRAGGARVAFASGIMCLVALRGGRGTPRPKCLTEASPRTKTALVGMRVIPPGWAPYLIATAPNRRQNSMSHASEASPVN